MTRPATPISTLQALAAHWRVLGHLAVAFGRQISMFHKMGARGGAAPAAMLEAWLYCALVELSAEIAAHSGKPACPADAEALEYLKTVHTLLSILALLITQLRRNLESWAAALSGFTQLSFAGPVPFAPAPVAAIGYLDSS